jgi:signal transduction histidine kinase
MIAFAFEFAARSYPHSGPRPFDALAAVLTLLASGPLTLRRRYPVATLLACTAAVAVYEARGYWLALNQLGPQTAFFTVATRRSRPWILACAFAVYPVIMYSNLHTWTGSALDVYLLSALWLVGLAVAGDGARRLREHNALVAEHAAQLQREQLERERRAVLLERIRLARELHDVVAHHMSVIAVQAGLAKYVFTSDPQTALKALGTVAETSSEGLEEVRRLVTVLRPDASTGDDRADAPAEGGGRSAGGIDQLPAMIERLSAAGVPVRYLVEGARPPVPAGVGLCVYRVVQESLTNVLKHAPGAQVEVRLHYAPTEIRVLITDDGRRAAAADRPGAADLGGSGKGLLGMRERAQLYGGTLTAGPRAGGGFEVGLRLPLRSLAPARS